MKQRNLLSHTLNFETAQIIVENQTALRFEHLLDSTSWFRGSCGLNWSAAGGMYKPSKIFRQKHETHGTSKFPRGRHMSGLSR